MIKTELTKDLIMNSIQYSLFSKFPKFITLSLFVLLSASLLLSACGKSEAELCIDKQSHLWNTKANSREENKIYWDAVAQCKQKFK